MLEPANMADKVTVVVIFIFLTLSCILASEEGKGATVPDKHLDQEGLSETERNEEDISEIGHSVKAEIDSETTETIGDSSHFTYPPTESENAFTTVNSEGNAIPDSYENGITATTGADFNASEKILNSTIQNATNEVNTTDAVLKSAGPKWKCDGGNYSKEFRAEQVNIIDDSGLQDWINVTTNGSRCVLVLFYARFCRFSAKLAPVYNALARAYDNLPILAMDAYQHNSLNARFGVIAVPTILLFYSGKPVLKFNNSISLEDFQEVIKNNTGLEGNSSVAISFKDYEGPLPSTPTVEVDFYLIFSSLFLLVLGCYLFAKSSYGQFVWDRIDQLPWQRIMHWFKREKTD